MKSLSLSQAIMEGIPNNIPPKKEIDPLITRQKEKIFYRKMKK
jgi:hypothetical protein